MQLCINLTHLHTRTHIELSDTKAEIHTRTTQLPFFLTYHALQLVGKLKAFLIQKLDVF